MLRQRCLSQNELPELTHLLESLELSDAITTDLTLTGADPVIYSPHRLGYASAVSLGLNAVLASMIWQYRSKQSVNAHIDIIDALHHLHDSHFIWQNGYKIDVGAENVAINNLFKCNNGRAIHTIAGPPYMKLLNGYLDFFNCANNKKAFTREFLKWDAFMLEEALSAKGLPACVARTKEEWLSHPVGQQLSHDPVIEIQKVAPGKPVAYSENAKVCLDNIKVLDFTHVLAGPLCGQNLALFGADVLHITSPYHRDTLAQNLVTNFGKSNAYLYLNNKPDYEKIREMIRVSDVFLNSYRPSVTKKFAIDVDNAVDLSERGIIYLDINCYGKNNRWSQRPGFETIGQVCSGFSVTEAEGDIANPVFSPVFYLNDPLTSYMALSGVLTALHRRAIEGGSYHVTVSLARTGMWVENLGTLNKQDYQHLPREDRYPAQFVEMNTTFGIIKRLAEAYQFDDNRLMVQNNLQLKPFGADTI